MLKLFEVAEFKNFSKKMTVDFSDVHDYQFHTDCITNGLIGKMIIYGRNSVGKSNLGLAMFDVVSHLTDQNVSPGLISIVIACQIVHGSTMCFSLVTMQWIMSIRRTGSAA